jgi:hypothetical protein
LIRTLLLLAPTFAATLLVTSLTLAGSAIPDAGISGTVPYYVDDLLTVQKGIELTKLELVSAPDDRRKALLDSIEFYRALGVKMRDQCVRVYDPQSMVPIAYSWTGFRGSSYLWGFGPGACTDERFPDGFMKLLGVAGCKKGGEFELPLASGRYAVSVGAAAGSGSAKWWKTIEIEPHEWLKLPPLNDYRRSCKSSADCSTNQMCRSTRKFSPRDGTPMNFSSKEGGTCEATCETDKDCYFGLACKTDTSEVPIANSCQAVVRTPPPTDHDSGVKGSAGIPVQFHGDMEPAEPVYERVCVKAFPEGSSYMVACAACLYSNAAFALPLPPGRYNLEFEVRQNGHLDRDHRSVEVSRGKWIQIDTLGVESGKMRP